MSAPENTYRLIFLLADYHEALRREQRWHEADAVRALLRTWGFTVRTTPQGWTEFDYWNREAWEHTSQHLKLA